MLLSRIHERLLFFGLVASVLALSSLLLVNQASAQPLSAAASKASTRKKLKKVFSKSGLSSLPQADQLVAKNKKGKKPKSAAQFSLASATPPTLAQIPGLEIKDLFWSEGVIDAIGAGTASREQCDQLFSSSTEGASGGFGACHLTEGVGRSFETLLQAQSSLCYMQKFPTQANLSSGGFSVTAGELPAGDPSKLFAAPAGSSDRLVRVAISGFSNGGAPEGEEGQGGPEVVMLKVHSQARNQAAGNAYGASLWFCSASNAANGYHEIEISNTGIFTSRNGQLRGASESEVIDVVGALTIQGNQIIWDTSKTRSAEVEFVREEGSFKGDIQITAANQIKTKSIDLFGSQTRRSYTVTRFSGSEVSDVRFLSGAFKEQFDSQTWQGAVEYLSSFYAAAATENNVLYQAAQAVDFEQDEFYSSTPSAEVDLSAYDCAAAPDVSVSLDFGDETLRESVADCEPSLRGMHFCFEDESVRAAEQNYGAVCAGQ